MLVVEVYGQTTEVETTSLLNTYDPAIMIHNGTHINYYHVCHRKLWLFHHGIQMEQISDLVYAGKLIDEQSYGQRSDKYSQIELDGIKIDFYDARNKVVHETKSRTK